MRPTSIALIVGVVVWALTLLYTRRRLLLAVQQAPEGQATSSIRRWARIISTPPILFGVLGEILDMRGGSVGSWLLRLAILALAAALIGWWASRYLAWTTRRDWSRGRTVTHE